MLSATTTISQSPSVDKLVNASRWVEDLYIPMFLIGTRRPGARDLEVPRPRAPAIRVSGILLAVVGALLYGIGAATPAFADAAATNDPGRGEAVAQFIDVLVGRLGGAGKGMIVVGIVLALAPGHDGGDLGHRWARVRAWFAAHPREPALAVRGWPRPRDSRLRRPDDPRRRRLGVGRGRRGARRSTSEPSSACGRAACSSPTIPSSRSTEREVALVLVAMIAGFAPTATAAVQVVAASTSTPRANPTDQGCNGYIELCAFAVNQIVWPASHNAMSSAAYDFLGPSTPSRSRSSSMRARVS